LPDCLDASQLLDGIDRNIYGAVAEDDRCLTVEGERQMSGLSRQISVVVPGGFAVSLAVKDFDELHSTLLINEYVPNTSAIGELIGKPEA
jgi:hypothetical protein